MLTPEQWKTHNEWERKWWGNCANTSEEQLKQEIYAEYMRLSLLAVGGHWFDLKRRSVLDIGGGPSSLLLRCKNFSRAVVLDPCGFPEWVSERYKAAGIDHIREMAEEYSAQAVFDEAWIYNCLQHVRSVEAVVRLAVSSAKKVRIFEYLNIGVCPGHPHNLTRDLLDGLFGKQGLIEKHDGLVHGEIYYGVFNYP